MYGVRLLAMLHLLVLVVVGLVGQGASSPTTSGPTRVGSAETAAVKNLTVLRRATPSQPVVSDRGTARSFGRRTSVEDALEDDDIEDDREASREVTDESVATRGLRAPRNAGQGLRDAPQSDTSCSVTRTALPRGPPAV